jgi:hypothetical protein
MKKCDVCKQLKDEEEYNWKWKNLGIKDATWRSCRKEYNKEYFNGSAKEKHLQQVRQRKQAAREFARDYVLNYLTTHPCIHCGESDVRVLEFHHIGDKEGTISKMVGEGYSTDRIQRELDKTQVLCANCHRKLTIDEQSFHCGGFCFHQQYFKYIVGFIPEQACYNLF